MYYLTHELNSIVLPTAIVERYRMADGPALKVALFLLCNGECDCEVICNALSMPAETVERSLAFWLKAGLISDVKIANSSSSTSKAQTSNVQSVLSEIKRTRNVLSHERASELSLRNPEIAILLQEAQRFLGRSLDSIESRTLIEIYEYNELPVDIILMLLAFCMPRVKNKRALCTMVSKLSDDWFELGINTSHEADKQIKLLEQREQNELIVSKTLELKDASFSKSQKQAIAKWFEEYNYNIDFVREAFKLKGNNSILFISKILQNWYNNGYTSVSEITNILTPNAQAPAKQKKGGGSLLKQAVLSKNGKED